MADARWTLGDGEATIQTELSPTMLPVVINADADKIIRNTLRAAGIPKFTLLPGAAIPAAAKKPRPAHTGSDDAPGLWSIPWCSRRRSSSTPRFRQSSTSARTTKSRAPSKAVILSGAKDHCSCICKLRGTNTA